MADRRSTKISTTATDAIEGGIQDESTSELEARLAVAEARLADAEIELADTKAVLAQYEEPLDADAFLPLVLHMRCDLAMMKYADDQPSQSEIDNIARSVDDGNYVQAMGQLLAKEEGYMKKSLRPATK